MTSNQDQADAIVVILPVVGSKVLMQLRDFREGIAFPGRWGFFGGSLLQGEAPEAGAKRELNEELGYTCDALRHLGSEHITDLGNIYSAAFSCPLTVNTSALRLGEGCDFKLVGLEEVESGKIFSERFNAPYPAAETYYILKTFKIALELEKR